MTTDSGGWDVCRAQAKLQTVYEQKYPGLKSALADADAETLSCPQLVDISAHNYKLARTKLLIFGQQTREWYDDWSNIKGDVAAHAVRELLQEYSVFNLGSGLRHTPFWHYAHELHTLLNPNGPGNGFIWSNLIKMAGLNKQDKWGYPGWLIEELINKSFDVLVSEVNLAEPDVVVFFTGHDYDECLERSFPGVRLSAVPRANLDSNWLAAVKHVRLPEHSYRTYHPGYLNRQRKGSSVLGAIRELVLGD